MWGHVLVLLRTRTPFGAVAPIATEDMPLSWTATTATPSSPPSHRPSHSAQRQASIETDHSHQTLGRTGPLLIADLGMGRAEGAARDRTPAQAEPRLAGVAVRPAALAEANRQYGRRRAGRHGDRSGRRCRRRPDLRRSRRSCGRPRSGDLLPAPLRPGRRRRARASRLRSTGQAQAIDLAQDGAAGDAGSQRAGYPGGRPAFLPEDDQSLGILGSPDGGCHGDALVQQAQSARPRPPFLLPPATKEGPALSRRAHGSLGRRSAQNGMSSSRASPPASDT